MHLNPFSLAFNVFCHLTSFLLTLVNVGFQLGLLTLLKKKLKGITYSQVHANFPLGHNIIYVANS